MKEKMTVPGSSVGADAGQSPMYEYHKTILARESTVCNDFRKCRRISKRRR